MKKALFILLGLCVIGLVYTGCSDNKPTAPKTNNGQPLAGGGRFDDDDPSSGREDTTYNNFPEPSPYPGLLVLFYSDQNCFGQPFQKIIRDSAEWSQWWDSAWTCLPVYSDSNWWPCDSSGMDSIKGDSMFADSADSGVIWPDSSYSWIPYIDFDSSVVIVIGLEEDTNLGRTIWINEDLAGSQINYNVSYLGEDCESWLMRPIVPNSPTIAMVAPKPLDEPIEWIRHDTVWNCSWEPDPNIPLTMYYTDTPCELGLGEQIIADQETYAQWVASAIACDSARWWNYLTDSGFIYRCGIIGGYGFEVDFDTHAVIILRAGSQTRWGGGIWLNGFETSDDNTVIDYAVMMPSDDCPIIEELPEVNPTVAIRVPKPIGGTVTWNRLEATIECSWSDSLYIDSSGIRR